MTTEREIARQRYAFERVLQFVPDAEGLRGEIRDFYDAACKERDALRSALLDMRVVLDELRGEDWVDEVAQRIEAVLVTAAKALHPYDDGIVGTPYKVPQVHRGSKP